MDKVPVLDDAPCPRGSVGAEASRPSRNLRFLCELARDSRFALNNSASKERALVPELLRHVSFRLFSLFAGASHFLWLCGCGETSPSFEEVEPADVFKTASYGEQGVGARFRPAASRLFESVAEDALVGTFHDAGSNRQSMLPIEVALHSVRVGLAGANADRDSFGPAPEWPSLGRAACRSQSSETAHGLTHAEPPQSRLQPSNTEPGRNAKTQNQLQPKKMGCTRCRTSCPPASPAGRSPASQSSHAIWRCFCGDPQPLEK